MIQVRISPAQRRKLESELKRFASKAQVAVGETVAIIGTSVAKELARKVQPFGLTNDAGKKMDNAIVMQVQKAARWAEFKGIQGDFKTIHTQLRRRGSVSVKPPKEFDPKRAPITRSEIWTQMQRKRTKAGQAKAGWITAGESIDSPLLRTSKNKVRKIKGIAQWIRRHVNSNKGSSRFVRKGGLNSTIYLTNNVDYAYSARNANLRYTPSAIADGYKRSITAAKRIFRNLK